MTKVFSKFLIIVFPIYMLGPPVYAQSPYESNWTNDGLIIGAGLVVALTGSMVENDIDPLTIREINDLNKNDINWFDRSAAGNYSISNSKASDYTAAACLVSPLILLIDSKIRDDVGTIATMYLETILFSTFMPSFGKGGVQRIRPRAYSTKVSLNTKLKPESRRSFPSGHATSAFSSAVFFATVYQDYYPNSKWKNYIWGGALLTASSVAYFRVGAGAHFPTDVLAGAALGSSIGYLIPYLHRSNKNSDLTIIPVYQRQKVLISFNYNF